MGLNLDTSSMEIFHVDISMILILYLLEHKIVLPKLLVYLIVNCLQLYIGQMKPMCYICKRR